MTVKQKQIKVEIKLINGDRQIRSFYFSFFQNFSFVAYFTIFVNGAMEKGRYKRYSFGMFVQHDYELLFFVFRVLKHLYFQGS